MRGRRGLAAPGVPGGRLGAEAGDTPLPGDQDTRKEGMRGLGRCSAQSPHVSLEWLARDIQEIPRAFAQWQGRALL